MWDEDYFACQVHKDKQGNQREAEVFCKEPLSQPKIAHELFHAKTSLILGDNGIMYAIPNQTKMFQYMMDKNNASNIVNACEHVIFFPDYLDMGFDEMDSFEQPHDLDARHRELKGLSGGLKENGHYSPAKVFQYLGLVFSFYFYPNDRRFRTEVRQLKKIDYPLFMRIKKLRDACTDLAIVPENKDIIQDAYYDFAVDMNAWFDKAFKGAMIP